MGKIIVVDDLKNVAISQRMHNAADEDWAILFLDIT